MPNKILFMTGEGIGNVIQTIPVIRTLKEVLGYEVDFWHAFGSFGVPKVIPYVDEWVRAGEIMYIKPEAYVGKVSTVWTRDYVNRWPLKDIPLLNSIKKLRMDRSEVDIYMDTARDLGVKEEDILWHGNCSYRSARKKYDVVIHNGYNPHGSANWKIKEYPYYTEVAKLLTKAGFDVCSVGAKEEYIEGTDDKTGFDLPTSLGIIKKAGVFLGNDSGLYHCANALEIPNVVIFTATSIAKNYDYRFHKYSAIVCREDLPCRPCQGQRRWNKDCKSWECREIDPGVVCRAVTKILMSVRTWNV